MINKGKIFIIEKPEQAGHQTRENNILQQIYDKTTFWERSITKNVVDMSEINFSVAKEILNELFSYKEN